MSTINDINRVTRDHVRFTGDGLPGEPVDAPLPVGDPRSGVFNLPKAALREIMIAILQAMGDPEALQQIKDALASKASLQSVVDEAAARVALAAEVDGKAEQSDLTAAEEARQALAAELADKSVQVDALNRRVFVAIGADGGIQFLDPSGFRHWLGSSGRDGLPDEYAEYVLRRMFGIQSGQSVTIGGEQMLLAQYDVNGYATDLALRLSDGQFADFALKRWWGRFVDMGLVAGGAKTLRANPYPPRLQSSIAAGQARLRAGTAPLAGAVNATINGQPVRMTLPSDYKDDRPVVVVLVAEGTDRFGETNGLSPRGDFSRLPNLAGVAYVSGALHGNSYGNADAMTDLRAIYEWMTSVIAVSGIVLFGNSMGGVAACNALTRDVLPGVMGLYLTDPAIDVEQRYRNGSSGAKANVAAAFGINADGSNFATQTAGFDPADADWTGWRGIPVKIIGSTTDTTVPFGLHAQLLADKLAQHNDVTLVNLGTGGHNATNRFNADDFKSFIDRCCGGPAIRG